MRPRQRLPEPSAAWTRWWFRGVPRPSGFFLDLGEDLLRYVPDAGPAHVDARPDPAQGVGGLDDAVWVPRSVSRSWRGDLLDRLRRRGVPRVVELAPDEEVEEASGEQELTLFAPIDELLAGESPRVPRGAVLLLPWIPGFTESEEVWGPQLEQARSGGASAVLVARSSLDDAAKRELARRADEGQYSELFHVGDRAEDGVQEVRSRARQLGLATVPERPLPAGPAKLRRNRRIAAALLCLAEAAPELSVSRAQELSRAARWIENEQRDLKAIAEDGNLKVIDWLPRDAHDTVRHVLDAGDGFRLADFERAYCSRTPM